MFKDHGKHLGNKRVKVLLIKGLLYKLYSFSFK